MNINDLLRALIKNKASDLHLKVGRPPLFRVSGQLVPTKGSPLNDEQVKGLAYSMMGPRHIQRFEDENEIDFSYALENMARFRVNTFIQTGHVGVVIRMIPYNIPSLDKLGLPVVIKDIASKNRGLVLVTGATGSGKSTTLAAVIKHVNNTKHCHILTLEDPIEFVHKDNLSTINQRELGTDTKSFQEGLKRALRQDPDVILVGEMRDLDTIATAITAAETGHLVLSTLHTNDARQTVDRIIDTFPSEQQIQIRIQLSSSLISVISQRLLKKADGAGRLPALEIMINSPTIQKYIAEGETDKINQAIEQSVTYYRMQTFNQDLARLCKEGKITKEEALVNSNNPEDLKLRLSGISSGSSTDQSPKGGEMAREFEPSEYLDVDLS